MDRFAANQGAALVQSDPIRVLQAVIVGISFLGAGTIVHARGSAVEGPHDRGVGLLERRLGTNSAPDQTRVADKKPARMQSVPPGSS